MASESRRKPNEEYELVLVFGNRRGQQFKFGYLFRAGEVAQEKIDEDLKGQGVDTNPVRQTYHTVGHEVPHILLRSGLKLGMLMDCTQATATFGW